METQTVDIQIKGTKADVEKITKDDIKIEASVKDLSTEGENSINWTATFKNETSNISIVNNTGSVTVSLTLKQ